MVLVDFVTDSGETVKHHIDGYLKSNLDIIKDSVLNKGWDYVAVVSGIPGVGKSTLAQVICKYLDPTFNTKDRICFSGTGENGLMERTSNAELGQAFMLDESFEAMNTKVSRSGEFVRIMNHLQLIRQKGLFIILCLPNFFDLNKTIAIFRTSHLFVVYHDKFKRGFFSGFGRDEKRMLYVKGNKFINYNCVMPNFRGNFTKEWIADQKLYDEIKLAHLKEQATGKEELISPKDEKFYNLVKYSFDKGIKTKVLADICGCSQRWIEEIIRKARANSPLEAE
jgi:hypothetical protein